MTILLNGFGNMGKMIYSHLKNNIVKVFSLEEEQKINSFKGNCDLIIDFSSPSSLDDIIAYCSSHKCSLIIGTTGYSEFDYQKINHLSKHHAIFLESNFSIGMNLLYSLLDYLNTLDTSDFDASLVELHRINKLDKPSGTSKEIIKHFKDMPTYSIRGGNVSGIHSINLLSNDEMIEIKHTSFSRDTYFQGIKKAISFLKDKENGIYNLKSVNKD